MSAFDTFASTVLSTYRMDKDAFWDAVTAPFLSENSAAVFLKHRKVGSALLSLFSAMEADSKALLKSHFADLGLNITGWKSFKAKAEYFKDGWPVYAFLAIWMEEQGAKEPLSRFGDILRAIAYGTAGYGILDVLVDGEGFTPLQLLAAQALIADYETGVLQAFHVSKVNFNILHKIRGEFLRSEMKEKALRFKQSPYRKEAPEECGSKAAHLLTSFMLCLQSLGRAEQIDAYYDVFMRFGAVIQILDDLKDLEDDIAIGHYSYVTIGSSVLEMHKKGKKPKEIAKSLLQDPDRMRWVHDACKRLIKESNDGLVKLCDPLLMRIVAVTELRLDAYFKRL